MDDQGSHFANIIVLSLSGLVSFIIAYIAYSRRRAPGGWLLTILMVIVAFWNWICALAWARPEPEWFFFWRNLSFFGGVASPFLFLLFAIQLTNHSNWLSKSLIVLLGIEPVLTLIMVWTDPIHQMFYGGMRAENATGSPVGGPWFWINTIYSAGLILSAFLILIQTGLYQTAKIYRKQIYISLIGVFLLVIVNIINLINRRPLPGLDLDPIFFSITGGFFAISILGFHFLDVVPVELGTLVNQMRDGLLVLDTLNRVVEINQSAAEIFHRNRDQLIGTQLQQLLQSIPELNEALDQNSTLPQEITLNGPPPRVLDILFSQLYDQNGLPQGRLLTWRDVTHLKKVENDLINANNVLQAQIYEIEALQETIREQAIRDPLTSLYNRRYLNEILPKETARADRMSMTLAFLMIDLDNFKTINDSNGHEVGDGVLQTIASYLEHAMRKGDVLIRYGGEEFLIILINVNLTIAQQRAEQFRSTVEKIVYMNGQTRIRTTISTGIAIYPTDGPDAIDVIRAADQALYEAKSKGRNRVCVA